MSYTSAVRLPRAVVRTLKAVALIALMVMLTGLGSQADRPPTAVLGAVEVPAVQILDAVCITNPESPEPC